MPSLPTGARHPRQCLGPRRSSLKDEEVWSLEDLKVQLQFVESQLIFLLLHSGRIETDGLRHINGFPFRQRSNSSVLFKVVLIRLGERRSFDLNYPAIRSLQFYFAVTCLNQRRQEDVTTDGSPFSQFSCTCRSGPAYSQGGDQNSKGGAVHVSYLNKNQG